jgi:DNA-binding GntR family transcriptional regulator
MRNLALVPTRSRSTVPRRAARSDASGSHAATSRARDDNASRVFRELRELIVWDQLPPGARITERTVADRLGVSRTPVRSALHRLQRDGFITTAGNGAEQRLIVAPMTREDGEELYLMVGHLEGFAARLAAMRPVAERKELVASLRSVNRELETALRVLRELSRVFDLDLEFHRLFVEAVAGPRTLALHRAIKPQIERYARAYIGVLLGELPNSLSEHEAIIRAIQKGDAKAAQLATEMNWQHAAERLLSVIGQYGERGSWHASAAPESGQIRQAAPRKSRGRR